MILVFFFALRSPSFRFLKSKLYFFVDIKGGIERLGWNVKEGVDFLFTRYLYLSGVEKENERLKKEIRNLRHLLMNSFFVREENARLLELFNIKPLWKDMVFARAFGSVLVGSEDEFFVDVGRRDGLKKGCPVVSVRGLVGALEDVGSSHSVVESVFSETFTASVIIVPGEVTGLYRGGNPGSVSFVFETEKVYPGDVVFTSGQDGKFPRGIPVGVVTSVSSVSHFKEIKVSPFASLKLGMFVGVLRK